jgi:hypothetical protein
VYKGITDLESVPSEGATAPFAQSKTTSENE